MLLPHAPRALFARAFVLVSISIVAALALAGPANAQLDNFGLGDGTDGAFTANAGTSTLNHVAPITAAVSAGATSVTIGTERTGNYAAAANISAGRLVLVVQSTNFTGTATDGSATAIDLTSNQVGSWELARISSYSAPTVTFSAPLVNSYAASGAQIVTIPEFTTATVAAGRTVQGPNWNGASGGFVGFLATGALTINGTISSAGRGFRGGTIRDTTATGCAQWVQGNNNRKGEGIVPAYYDAAGGDTSNGVGAGNKANGAGGGNCAEGGGGGGSNHGAGGKGGNTSDGNRDFGGRGGAPLTYSAYDHFVFGGGGGSGDDNTGANGAGGAGGGVVFVRGASLAGTGTLTAAGAAGAGSTAEAASAGGGGGGGVLYARFTGAVACTSMTVAGGAGGSVSSAGTGNQGSPGGGGGGGKIVRQGSSFSCANANGGGANGTLPAGGADGAVAGSPGNTISNTNALSTPTVTLTAPADNLFVASTSTSVSGTATANSTVHIWIDGVSIGSVTANGAGNWSTTASSLSQGAHTVYAQSVVDSIWSNPSATNDFTVDTIAPTVSISAPTASQWLSTATTSVSFSVTEANPGTTECRIDTGSWTSCSTGWTTPSMTAGSHSIQVRHTDLAGNVGSSSVTVNVDLTDPVVAISAPAASSYTSDTTPDISFSVTETNAGTTECRVDGGSWGACSAPTWTTGTLTSASHTVEIRHTDLSGRVGSASRTFTVDAVLPVVTISSPADGALLAVADPAVSFSVTEDNPGTTECSTDGSSWSSCTTGWQPTLSEGANSLYVRHTDLAGNVGQAVHNVTVDTIAPDAPVLSDTPPALTNSDSASITVTAAESGGTLECRLDGGAWGACGPLSGLSDGSHTFEARQTDDAGNVSPVADYTWTVDTTPPPAPVVGGPSGTSASDNEDISFSNTEPGVTFYCSLDSEPATVCTSPVNVGPLSDGPHTYEVYAEDAAGNQSSVGSVSWTTDTTGYVASIDSAPATPSSNPSPDFAFSATLSGSTFYCQIDSDPEYACSSPDTVGPLADGEHTFSVYATRGAQTTPVVSHTWTIDTTGPSLSVTAPAESATTGPDVDVEFSASDLHGPVTYTCDVDGGGANSCTSPLELTGLSDGAHSVSVTATDALGNNSTVVRNWTVDATAPGAPAIDTPADGSVTSDPSPQISGTAEANSEVEVSIDGNVVGTTTADGSGNWSFTPASPLIDGPHTVSATATDAYGNTSSATENDFTVDTTAPSAPTIDAPADGSLTNDSTPAISGTAEAGSEVEVSIDGNAIGTVTADGSGNWTITPGTPLSDGSHSVSATATDAAGNTSAAAENDFIVDTTDPALSVTAPTEGATTGPDVDVEFDATDTNGPVTYTCAVDGGSANSCTSPLALTGLSTGAHSVTVTATDAAGNTSTVVRTWTVDATAPAAPAIDTPADGSVTNDSTPTISGTAEADSEVEVSIDGNVIGTVTTDGSGNWTITPGTPLSDGPHTVSATATDAYGNTSSAGENDFTVDTAAPAAPAIDTPADGSVTGDDTPTISGTAEADSEVEVSIDGNVIGTVTADGSGNWSITPGSSLTDGPHTVSATATDAAGNTSPATENDFTVDTAAPAAPAIDTPADGSVTGDDTPTISGTAEADSEVEVSIDGNVIGTVIADGSGNWTITPGTPLSDGPHTVSATATDAAGNTSPATENDFTVDTAAPAAPVIDTPSDGSLTNDDTPTISGTAEADSEVEVSIDGNVIGTVTADGSGNWSITPGTPLSAGSHTVSATATDAAGNTSAATEHDFTVDTTAPAVDVTVPAEGATTGPDVEVEFDATDINGPVTYTCAVDGGSATSCTSPLALTGLSDGAHTVTVTATDAAGNSASVVRNWTVDATAPAAPVIDTPSDGALTNDSTPQISGTAEADSEVEVSIDGNVIGTVTADGSGNWSITPGTPLSNGPHTVSATATDAYGNSSSASENDFTVDISAPTLDVTAPTEGATTGPDVDVEFDATDINGPVTYTCAVDGGSATSCSSPLELTGLSDGAHTVTVTATDAAGNSASVVRNWTVDATAPAAPAIDTPADGSLTSDTTPTISGTAEADSEVEVSIDGNVIGTVTADGSGNWTITPGTPLSDGPHTVSATATDAYGNTSSAGENGFTVDATAPSAPAIDSPADGSLTNDPTPAISGTAEAGSEVEVSIDGDVIGTVTADGSGNWSITPGTPLSDGPHTVSATATDAAGNTSSATENDFTVDATAPSAPAIDSPADGSLTNDTTPAISGTAEAGSEVEVSIDGDVIGTVTADGSGNWSITPGTPLSAGLHTVSATATDAAGNTSSASSNDFTVDDAGPDLSVTAPAEAATTGPNVDVMFDATDTNGPVTYTCAVDGGSATSCSSPLELTGLSDGAHTVTVTATDAAGNSASVVRNWTVDATAPDAPAIDTPADGSVTNNATPEISGTAEAGSEVEVSVDGNVIGTVTADGNGDWSITPSSPLSEGAHTVSATATDAYGNTSSASDNDFTVDVTVPSVTISSPANGALLSSNDVTIEFDASDSGAITITCTLDGSPVTPCDEPSVLLSDLEDGTHSFVVSVLDAGGNSASASVSFTVDTTAPDAPTIDEPGDGDAFDNGSVTVSGTAEANSSIALTLNGNPVGATITADGDGNWTYAFSPALADDSYTVAATATDAAGNESASNSVNFTVDTTAPGAPVISAPADGALTGDSTPGISGTAEPNSTVEVSIDGTPVGTATADGNGDWTFTPSTPLSDGSHTVSATATDAAGNTSAASSTNTFTVDAGDPVVVISTPANGSTTSDSTPLLTFGVTDNSNTTTTCTIDNGTPFACESGDDLPTLNDGSHTLVVTATDGAGNSAGDTTTFTVDTTAPSASIDDAPPALDNDATPTFEFSSNENDVTFECRIDGGAWTPCTSPLTTGTLSDGEHTFSVRATDEAGNTGSADSHSWTIDTTPPAVPVITSPADGSATNDSTPTVSGTGENGSQINVFVDGNLVCTATVTGGTWNCIVSPALTDGLHEITATAEDELGNESGESNVVELTVDTTAPNGTVTKGGTDANPTFNITSDDPTASISCTLSPGGSVPCTPPTYIPSGLAPGDYTLTVTFTDGVGNSTVRAINFRIPAPQVPDEVPPQADPTACFAKGVTIYNMKVKGKKMTISGFARTSYAGKEVTINFQPTKSKVIGRTTVNADGSFTATVAAPAKKLRKKGTTRYRANVPGESSLWFKFDRRMGSNEATFADGSLKVAGFLTKPLDPKSVLTITARTGCNEPWKKIGTAKINKRSGAFSASLPYQPSTGVVFVRMYAKVRKTAKSKKTMTTYSFVIPVVTHE